MSHIAIKSHEREQEVNHGAQILQDSQGDSHVKQAAMLPGASRALPAGGIFKTAAVEVLRRERRLMTTGEICRLALDSGLLLCSGKTPEATMASSLYGDIKRNGQASMFIRPQEGMFGLREWVDAGLIPAPPPHPSETRMATTGTTGKRTGPASKTVTRSKRAKRQRYKDTDSDSSGTWSEHEEEDEEAAGRSRKTRRTSRKSSSGSPKVAPSSTKITPATVTQPVALILGPSGQPLSNLPTQMEKLKEIEERLLDVEPIPSLFNNIPVVHISEGVDIMPGKIASQPPHLAVALPYSIDPPGCTPNSALNNTTAGLQDIAVVESCDNPVCNAGKDGIVKVALSIDAKDFLDGAASSGGRDNSQDMLNLARLASSHNLVDSCISGAYSRVLEVEDKVHQVEQRWGKLHALTGRAHLLLYHACRHKQVAPLYTWKASEALRRALKILEYNWRASGVTEPVDYVSLLAVFKDDKMVRPAGCGTIPHVWEPPGSGPLSPIE